MIQIETSIHEILYPPYKGAVANYEREDVQIVQNYYCNNSNNRGSLRAVAAL